MKTRSDLLEDLRVIGLIGVLQDACKAHFVALEDVLSSSRKKSVCAARRACFMLLRGAPYNRSLTEIGDLMGRDHTSVMAALKQAVTP